MKLKYSEINQIYGMATYCTWNDDSVQRNDRVHETLLLSHTAILDTSKTDHCPIQNRVPVSQAHSAVRRQERSHVTQGKTAARVERLSCTGTVVYLTRTAEARLKLVATRPHEQRGVAELRHRDIVAGGGVRGQHSCLARC